VKISYRSGEFYYETEGSREMRIMLSQVLECDGSVWQVKFVLSDPAAPLRDVTKKGVMEDWAYKKRSWRIGLTRNYVSS
jgi:hypothetical protein